MDKLFTLCDVKEFSDSERSLVAWASRPVLDRDREIIEWDAWELEDYQKNPVLMFAHDYKQPPVGKTLWIKKTPDGLKFKPQFAKTPIGEELYQLYKDGIMRAFSVGFVPTSPPIESSNVKEGEPLKRYTKTKLLEVSCVSIPSCPDALVEAARSGKIKTKEISDTVIEIAQKIEDIHTKPETTEEYHHIPVRSAGLFVDASFRTIDISKKEGIKAVIGKLKSDPGGSTVVQKFMFHTDRWSMEEAKKWVKEHEESKEVVSIEELLEAMEEIDKKEVELSLIKEELEDEKKSDKGLMFIIKSPEEMDKIRKENDLILSKSGHHYVYEFIPQNEIWIDGSVPKDSILAIKIKEMAQLLMMQEGIDYDLAESISSIMDKDLEHLKEAHSEDHTHEWSHGGNHYHDETGIAKYKKPPVDKVLNALEINPPDVKAIEVDENVIIGAFKSIVEENMKQMEKKAHDIVDLEIRKKIGRAF